MEQHGKNLARRAPVWRPAARPTSLLARLAENERVLIEVCDLLTAAVTANRRITPAAEWLLDNFYLIEEQIRTAKRHLPKGYSRELPRLAHGPSAHAAARLRPRVRGDLARRRQRRRRKPFPLRRRLPDSDAAQVGELWAIPIMLRLALIENLRRVGVADRGRHDRSQPRRLRGRTR